MKGRALAALALAFAPALPACSGLVRLVHRPPVLAECPGPLPSAETAPEGLRRRARVRARGDGVDESFGVVLEKHGGALSVLGLTRMGAKAFALRQRGTDVEVVTPRSPVFPVPPENVLRDLHAADLLRGGEPRLVRRPGCGYEARLVPLTEAEGARGEHERAGEAPPEPAR